MQIQKVKPSPHGNQVVQEEDAYRENKGDLDTTSQYKNRMSSENLD
jgi:hypothetical protein